jgi:DNA-binding NarL/FixJ family response regulator
MDSTILIVDDNDGLRIALRDWLEMMLPQYGVIDAGSAEEALDITKTYAPSVVIMDIKLPKMNGIEATREIKKARPETKVVMVTNHEQAILQDLAEDAGASAFVAKSALNIKLIPILLSLL